MDLLRIKKSPEYISLINDFIKSNKSVTLSDLIRFCHGLSQELESFCVDNEEKFRSKSLRDKGLLGKLVEFFIFGNLPNSDSKSDLEYGDIKTTHLKKLKDGSFNAKERLTLTNLGDPFKKEVLDDIITKGSIKETKHYEKLSKGIIVFCQYDKLSQNSLEGCMDKKIMGVVLYDINTINYNDIQQINEDFEKIKKCLMDGKPTQSGQKFLHIHRHSNGGKDNTRAFGFTNKFLTKLIADNMGLEFIESGRKYFINF
jgi:hypothetical protein